MEELWAVRHGETEWSRSGQHTGRTDVPLTAEGVRRAERLGRHLAGREFSLVLTSPLQRAAETCRLAGFGDVAEHCDDLMEWDYGAYEGRRTADIRVEVPDWNIWDGGVPDGESPEQVAERARRVIARAEASPGRVALFAHGHLLRILAATWIGLEPSAGRLLPLSTAAVSVLGYEKEWRALRRWNLEPGGNDA